MCKVFKDTISNSSSYVSSAPRKIASRRASNLYFLNFSSVLDFELNKFIDRTMFRCSQGMFVSITTSKELTFVGQSDWMERSTGYFNYELVSS